jgi:hypothetical protein
LGKKIQPSLVREWGALLLLWCSSYRVWEWRRRNSKTDTSACHYGCWASIGMISLA